MLALLPGVFTNFRDLCMPWIDLLRTPLLKFSQQSCLKDCDMEVYFEILELLAILMKSYGVGSIDIVKEVAF